MKLVVSVWFLTFFLLNQAFAHFTAPSAIPLRDTTCAFKVLVGLGIKRMARFTSRNEPFVRFLSRHSVTYSISESENPARVSLELFFNLKMDGRIYPMGMYFIGKTSTGIPLETLEANVELHFQQGALVAENAKFIAAGLSQQNSFILMIWDRNSGQLLRAKRIQTEHEFNQIRFLDSKLIIDGVNGEMGGSRKPERIQREESLPTGPEPLELLGDHKK